MEKQMNDERIGLVPDDRFPCGYSYCPYGCYLTECDKFGQVERCKEIYHGLEETVR